MMMIQSHNGWKTHLFAFQLKYSDLHQLANWPHIFRWMLQMVENKTNKRKQKQTVSENIL